MFDIDDIVNRCIGISDICIQKLSDTIFWPNYGNVEKIFEYMEAGFILQKRLIPSSAGVYLVEISDSNGSLGVLKVAYREDEHNIKHISRQIELINKLYSRHVPKIVEIYENVHVCGFLMEYIEDISDNRMKWTKLKEEKKVLEGTVRDIHDLGYAYLEIDRTSVLYSDKPYLIDFGCAMTKEEIKNMGLDFDDMCDLDYENLNGLF